MDIVINYSKNHLPFIRIGDKWMVNVLKDKQVLMSNLKNIKDNFMLVINGKYTNIEKARTLMSDEDFNSVLLIMRTNCLLQPYLEKHKLVAVKDNNYANTVTIHGMIKHIVTTEKKSYVNTTIVDNSLNTWSEIIVKGPKPIRVRGKHKPSTLFFLENNLWVLVSNIYETGISTLICLSGEDKGKTQEYLTEFINELVPSEIVIEVPK